MKVNKAQTKTETIGSDAKTVGGLDGKLENSKVKDDAVKFGEAVHSLFSHMNSGIENTYGSVMNTRRGKQYKFTPRVKGHTNKAKFSKRAKLKRRKAR